MAVSVNGKTVVLTAQNDEFPMPIVIKRIDWVNATSIGHLLAVSESSTLGDNTKQIYRDSASTTEYTNGALIETYYPRGVEITDLDSGVVLIVME